jgi:hypothetical protein
MLRGGAAVVSEMGPRALGLVKTTAQDEDGFHNGY